MNSLRFSWIILHTWYYKLSLPSCGPSSSDCQSSLKHQNSLYTWVFHIHLPHVQSLCTSLGQANTKFDVHLLLKLGYYGRYMWLSATTTTKQMCKWKHKNTKYDEGADTHGFQLLLQLTKCVCRKKTFIWWTQYPPHTIHVEACSGLFWQQFKISKNLFTLFHVWITCKRKPASDHQPHYIMAGLAEPASLAQLVHWQERNEINIINFLKNCSLCPPLPPLKTGHTALKIHIFKIHPLIWRILQYV